MSKTTAGGATSAPACCPRIPILPIRYAVVPNADGSAVYRYAKSGFNLEAGFQRMQLSSYTLRALRPGYVYVFMKGPNGEKLVIHEYDGEGHYQELTYTGLEDYDKKNKYRTGARMGWVWADTSPDTAKEVWIGYSTHLWTNAMTARIAKDSEARQLHMRSLDMVELTSGVKSPSGQAHILPADALTDLVEDFKPLEQRMPLEWSCHASEDNLSVATFVAQGNHYRFTRPRVPAVVALNDAEGISLDLGLIAAAYQHQITDLKRKPGQRAEGASPHYLPDCLSLDVEQIHLASSEFHHKNLTALLLTRTLKSMFPADRGDPANIASRRGEWHRNQPTNRSIPSQEELEYEVLTEERMSSSGARLAKRIDKERYFNFLRQRKEADAQLRVMMHELEQASSDHDYWISTAESKHKVDPKSLAAAFQAFDRNNRQSAAALELSIALMLQSMTQSLAIKEDGDSRYDRLEKWCDDPESAVYVSLAAFNPFKDKADAVGSILGAADSIISELGLKFPAIDGVTDLTSQTVTTVVLKRLNGKTRWDASRNLRQQVLAAAREANLEKALGLMAGRYITLDELIKKHELSKELQELVDKGMAEVELTSSTVKVKGNRTVLLEKTQTATVKPKIKSLSATAIGTGFNFGMVYFNIINVGYALKTLEKKYSHEAATNFASALVGIIASMGAAALSTRTAYSAVVARFGYKLPGLAFSVAIKKVVLSKLYGRLTGGFAILLGLLADAQKGYRLGRGGNDEAKKYTYAGAVFLAAGVGMATYPGAIAVGLSAVAGASAGVPVAGWIAAVVALTGAAIMAVGGWFQARAAAEAHSPIELWAARCRFGTLKNDGEQRDDIVLDEDRKLPTYPDAESEIKGWYQAFFAPILLDSDQVETLEMKDIGSGWHDNWLSKDQIEFVVLLPGFIVGQSTWDGGVWSIDRRVRFGKTASLELPTVTIFGDDPTCTVTSSGLVLHYQIQNVDYASVLMKAEFTPNQGLDEDVVVKAKFLFKD
ncbi:T6SS effector BTH_I2691 family protein [Achromobacter animicus]|uniref:T6SS effector BTH_I2691 family protein n=1 Tax=Achromobacter animicus TaxID=1389935 RepID=UPI0028A869DB|nr:T6SS effector BTH_I2691 family protein [Achromobacter animicus]